MQPKHFGCLIFMLLFSFSLNAQIKASFGNPDPITQNRYSGVKGSPYLFEDWMPGKIFEFEGETIQLDKINFNTENGKIEVMDDKGAITIINEVLYHKVEIEIADKVHTFSNRLAKGDINYYKIIYRGKNLGFMEKTISEIQRDATSDYNAYSYTGSFDTKTNYYILKDGTVREVFRSKKKILDFLGSTELAQFVKKEKLNLKKDSDLVKAFEFMESQIK